MIMVVRAVVRGDKCYCYRSAILQCFLGGMDEVVSGIGEVFVVEVVMAWYYWRGGGNCDDCCKSCSFD